MGKSRFAAKVSRDEGVDDLPPDRASRGWREWLRLIFSFGLVLFAVVEIALNGQRVQLDVTWWTWHTELWIALGAAWGLGLVFGLLVPAVLRHRRDIRR